MTYFQPRIEIQTTLNKQLLGKYGYTRVLDTIVQDIVPREIRSLLPDTAVVIPVCATLTAVASNVLSLRIYNIVPLETIGIKGIPYPADKTDVVDRVLDELDTNLLTALQIDIPSDYRVSILNLISDIEEVVSPGKPGDYNPLWNRQPWTTHPQYPRYEIWTEIDLSILDYSDIAWSRYNKLCRSDTIQDIEALIEWVSFLSSFQDRPSAWILESTPEQLCSWLSGLYS